MKVANGENVLATAYWLPGQLPWEMLIPRRKTNSPSAVRDAAPDAWGRRVIEHKLERSLADLQEMMTCSMALRMGPGT